MNGKRIMSVMMLMLACSAVSIGMRTLPWGKKNLDKDHIHQSSEGELIYLSIRELKLLTTSEVSLKLQAQHVLNSHKTKELTLEQITKTMKSTYDHYKLSEEEQPNINDMFHAAAEECNFEGCSKYLIVEGVAAIMRGVADILIDEFEHKLEIKWIKEGIRGKLKYQKDRATEMILEITGLENPHQINEMGEYLLKLFDLNEDGNIGKEELDELILRAYWEVDMEEPKKEQRNVIAKVYDRNKDSKWTLDEIKDFFAKLLFKAKAFHQQRRDQCATRLNSYMKYDL